MKMMINICCNRTCKCEILYKHFNRTLNRTEFKIDLTNKLPQRPLSYYCNDEVRECIDDCKIAAGEELRNEQIKQVFKQANKTNHVRFNDLILFIW